MKEVLDQVRRWTSTNIFIVPTLGIQRKRLTENGFVNAFIKDENRGIEFDRGVYLLFKPINADKFEEFLEEERNRKARIIDEYELEDGHIMVVYQYDKIFEKDVTIIMDGKFSETSQNFQNAIPKTAKVAKGSRFVEILTIQHCIFKKTQDYADYWDDLYGLKLNHKVDEFWHHYKEREIYVK